MKVKVRQVLDIVYVLDVVYYTAFSYNIPKNNSVPSVDFSTTSQQPLTSSQQSSPQPISNFLHYFPHIFRIFYLFFITFPQFQYKIYTNFDSFPQFFHRFFHSFSTSFSTVCIIYQSSASPSTTKKHKKKRTEFLPSSLRITLIVFS